MKRKELEKRLKKLKWQFLRHGGKHDVWWNGADGGIEEFIPRHKEIREGTAMKILKTARENPGNNK